MPLLDNQYRHDATEAYAPDGEYSVWLTYALILIPLGLISWDWLRRQWSANDQQTPA